MSNAILTFTTKVEDMKAGLKSGLPSSVNGVPTNGQMVPLNQVDQTFQQYLDADANAQLAKAALEQAVAARNALKPTTRQLLQAATVLVKQLFAGDATTLAKFGVTSKPAKAASVAKKAASVAKGQLTRQQKKAAAPASAQERVVVFDAEGHPIGDTQASSPLASAIPPASGSGTK
jgi:hypothetical protein